ncbi:MAG: hypothetical protein WCJ57_01825 [Candidatus Falkowbacteria bacterium]
MTEKPENLRLRLINLLNRVGGTEVLESDAKDDMDLIFFGIDDLDKTDSLPWELQQEFNIYFGDLSKIETLGELVSHVQSEIEAGK